MEVFCPECQKKMQWLQKQDYLCTGCQIRYQQNPICLKCNLAVEQLIACGAVNYFCIHGDGMLSKSQVIFTYQAYEKPLS